LTVLALLWIAWCLVHSLLISRQAHTSAEKVLGGRSGIYRILYILVSVLTLLPVLWFQLSLQPHIILPATLLVRFVQGGLIVYSLLMFYLGARVYDMSFFLGITQWQEARKNKKPQSLPFHTDGILAYVRHPWYSGGIAFIWGFGNITDIFLLTRLILTAYFIIGTIHEEQRLVIELGDQYRMYRKRVPMLVPWKQKNHRM